jgi:hypothetical protein
MIIRQVDYLTTSRRLFGLLTFCIRMSQATTACVDNKLHFKLFGTRTLVQRHIEDLLVERGLTVSRESIRLWCIKFGAIYSRRLKRKHRS